MLTELETLGDVLGVTPTYNMYTGMYYPHPPTFEISDKTCISAFVNAC